MSDRKGVFSYLAITFGITYAIEGALILAGREVQPSGIPTMIQGVIMVCLIASDFFLRNKVTIRRRVEE